jgi:hypothetical protein
MDRNLIWAKILPFFSFVVLFCHLIHLIVVWTEIPSNISIHFINGEPNKWGSKLFLLVMPPIGLLTWWLLGKLTKHPEKLNYINLNDKNRKIQYKMTQKIMVATQNLAFLTFIFANESFLMNALGSNNETIFFVLSIASIVLILLVNFYNLVWAARLKV